MIVTRYDRKKYMDSAKEILRSFDGISTYKLSNVISAAEGYEKSAKADKARFEEFGDTEDYNMYLEKMIMAVRLKKIADYMKEEGLK